MNFRSVSTRLTLWYTLVLSVALLLFSGATWMLVRGALHADQRRALTEQSKALETYLQLEDTESRERLAHECEEYSRSLPGPQLLAVLDPQETIVCTNIQDGGELIRRLTSRSAGKSPTPVIYRGQRYLATGGTAKLREGMFRTVVGVSQEANARVISLLTIVLCGMVPLFTIGGIFGGYWLSRRALAPVDQITSKAKSIGLSNLSERLPVPHTGDELQRLLETWNQMLARLEGSIAAMKQFTADASHELRTPLTIIRLAAEKGLSRSREEREYRQALQQVARESEMMTSLVENLLFLAQSESTAYEPVKEPVEIVGLIRRVLGDFEIPAQKKEITIKVPSFAGKLHLRGDILALTRLFRILIDNAIKYTPPRGCVRVSVKQRLSFAAIEVVDNGLGIPEESRQKVFERFYRVDESRSRDSGGYGLGLAIASIIVQQHGGSIDVKSEPSGGSLFSVELPL